MANPEALSLVEKWLGEVCPQTLDQKSVHIVAKLSELAVWTYKDKGVAQCHPGRAFLASLVNWSVSKVSRLTSKLKKWGILTKVQPRLYEKATGNWQTLTTVYSLTFLTPARIKQLASVLGIALAHMKAPFFKTKEKREKSCEHRTVRKVASVVGNVAREVYARVMNMAKGNEEPKGEIKTSNIAMNALLNRFATLGRPTL